MCEWWYTDTDQRLSNIFTDDLHPVTRQVSLLRSYLSLRSMSAHDLQGDGTVTPKSSLITRPHLSSSQWWPQTPPSFPILHTIPPPLQAAQHTGTLLADFKAQIIFQMMKKGLEHTSMPGQKQLRFLFGTWKARRLSLGNIDGLHHKVNLLITKVWFMVAKMTQCN